MPVYEYRCTACGNEFEYEHRMSEKKTTCERCQGELERLISRTSFSFKGGGWYKDLYSSAKPSTSSDSSSSDSSSSSSDKGSSSSDKGSSSSGSDSGSSSSSGSGGSVAAAS